VAFSFHLVTRLGISRIEGALLGVSAFAICVYYLATNRVVFYFIFESAGVPLLLIILIYGRQPQKIEAFKCMLYYIAILALPILIILLNLRQRVSTLMAVGSFYILLPFLAKTPAY